MMPSSLLPRRALAQPERLPSLAALLLVLAGTSAARADAPVAVPFTPQNRPVTGFGYGSVKQVLSSGAGSTGEDWCKTTFGPAWSCLSVSGAISAPPEVEATNIGTPDTPNRCDAIVPAGELVACNTGGSMPDAPLSDPALATPSSCDSPLLDDGDERDWCNGTGGLNTNWPFIYMGHRDKHSIYQLNDYVRVGVNREYGGTIFELYGSNKVNLIRQVGGAAMQLSLWAFDPDPAALPQGWFALPSDGDNTCDATAYPSEAECRSHHQRCQQAAIGGTVSDCVSARECGPWWSVAGPYNPIQAQSADCALGDSGRVDTVTAPQPGEVEISKHNPYNFTKTSAYEGLTWTQNTAVNGPFARVTYHITQVGGFTGNVNGQELPAFWTRQNGVGHTVYFYEGNAPYADATSAVSAVEFPSNADVGANFMFPRSDLPAVGQPQYKATEDWVSTCNEAGDTCLTMASFSPDLKFRSAQRNANGSNSIFTGWGMFALQPGLDLTVTEYYFPYRFDDVVMGQTIRQWIHDLKSGKPLPTAGTDDSYDAPDGDAGAASGAQADGAARDPGAALDGGSTPRDAAPADDAGGCACDATGSPATGSSWLLASALAVAVLRGRRRLGALTVGLGALAACGADSAGVVDPSAPGTDGGLAPVEHAPSGGSDAAPPEPACTPSASAPAQLQAAALSHAGCGSASPDSSDWLLDCAGSVETCVDIAVAGRYQLDVEAALHGAGAPPTLRVGIDGVELDDRALAVEWPFDPAADARAGHAYVLLARLSAGPHRLTLRRTEGAGASLSLGAVAVHSAAPPADPLPPPDRYWNDVPLTWYPVHGSEAPMPRVVLPPDQGPLQPTAHVGGSGPRDGDPGALAQNASGYSEYAVVFPNDGPYDFDVFASGDSFAGAPRMQLSVDGDPIGTVVVPSTTSSKLSFRAPLVSAGQHLIEVGFLNDLATAGAGDRNLVIHSVDITEPGAGDSLERIDNGVGGQFGVGQYSYGPDSMGGSTGEWYGVEWHADGSPPASTVGFSSSAVFPHTARNVYVYVPPGVDRTQPLPFMVFQDGLSYCGSISGNVDHLVAEHAMPATVLVCSTPGSLTGSTDACQQGDDDCERSFEYDSVTDAYFHYVVDELLPFASQLAHVTLTTDPNLRGIGGGSSGGIAAFTVGFFHPESFRKIYTSSASFADIRHHGGNAYPQMILDRQEPLPLRVTLTAGSHDFDCFGNVGADCAGDPHAWADANKRVAAALNARQYAYRFQYGTETHVGALATTTQPDDLRWLWSK